MPVFHVIATAASEDIAYVQSLGAEKVLDYRTTKVENEIAPLDIVLDLVGGETRDRSARVLKPGGILVSVVSPFPTTSRTPTIRTVFFLVEVTTARLSVLTDLFDRHKLRTQLGTVLPLEEARTAHEMLAGAPHKRGKIVLQLANEENT